jgi:hypothetical protein
LIFPPQFNCGQNNEQSECLLRPQLFIPTVPFKRNVYSYSVSIVYNIHSEVNDKKNLHPSTQKDHILSQKRETK